MDNDLDVRQLLRLLLFGSEATRRELGARLRDADPIRWTVLVDTVRSDESPKLRGRCLEVLGYVVADATDDTTVAVLTALTAASATTNGASGSARSCGQPTAAM